MKLKYKFAFLLNDALKQSFTFHFFKFILQTNILPNPNTNKFSAENAGISNLWIYLFVCFELMHVSHFREKLFLKTKLKNEKNFMQIKM